MKLNKHHGSQNRTKRPGGLGAVGNYVVHYTGGTGSALNNCKYFAGGNRNASADWFIDKNGTIWEYNDPREGFYTWAVGDGKGKYGITNTNSVHVEVVNTGDAFTGEQIKALNELYAYACKITGKKLKVVRHYDASHKACPAYYVNASRWNALKAKIEQSAKWIKDPKGWWYRNADGTWPASKWLKLDAWYYFNAEGYAVTGWHKINGYWYYFDSNCRMQTGWKKPKNKWYYLHPSKDEKWPEGSAHIGWIKLNGKWYYLKKKSEGTECSMACNETMTIDGKSYTFDSEGRMK